MACMRRATRFSTLLDIDKLTLCFVLQQSHCSFSTLLDIDKLTLYPPAADYTTSFSTLLDIDKLTRQERPLNPGSVLVLCWILINLHNK